MYLPPGTIDAAKRYGNDSIARKSTDDTSGLTRVDKVIDLLVNATSPGAEAGARELLQQMGLAPWDLIKGVHKSPKDLTPHITVSVQSRRHHIRLDAQGCVFDVTLVNSAGETIRPSGHRPWVRPGAPG
jgi:hypothetical protein